MYKTGNKVLYYFTDSYPYSNEYTWKTSEVLAAAAVFDEVIVVPFTYKKCSDISFPANVKIERPTLGKVPFAKFKYLPHLFTVTQPYFWPVQAVRSLLKGRQSFIDWYLATVVCNKLACSRIFRSLKNRDNKNEVVLFFQWTMNNALLIPSLRKWGYTNIVCRMHGFDLYEFRHNDYVPYKKQILRHANYCTFISKHGLDYAKNKYPFIAEKTRVDLLGSKAFQTNPFEHLKNSFHLVSVSRVVPLKRLHLIAQALALLDFDVKWTHIGDGDIMDELRKEISKIITRKNLDIHLLGWLSPEKIEQFFNSTSIDGFILVSETEGLPVSIMEAMSAAIPVIATDVGGVNEIVNSTNGVLLNCMPTIAEIAEAISFLNDEDVSQRRFRRQLARKTYELNFNLEENSQKFINYLFDLI